MIAINLNVYTDPPQRKLFQVTLNIPTSIYTKGWFSLQLTWRRAFVFLLQLQPTLHYWKSMCWGLFKHYPKLHPTTSTSISLLRTSRMSLLSVCNSRKGIVLKSEPISSASLQIGNLKRDKESVETRNAVNVLWRHSCRWVSAKGRGPGVSSRLRLGTGSHPLACGFTYTETSRDSEAVN